MTARILVGGTISRDIRYLTSFQNWILFNTTISGSLPTEFGKLVSLINLVASDTFLSGSLPDSFRALTRLKTVNFAKNRGSEAEKRGKLTGSLRVFNSSVLSCLHLFSNDFSGGMNHLIGLSPDLLTLLLHGNPCLGAQHASCDLFSSIRRQPKAFRHIRRRDWRHQRV